MEQYIKEKTLGFSKKPKILLPEDWTISHALTI